MHPDRTIRFLAVVVDDHTISPRAPEGKAWVCMGAAICFTDRVWVRPKSWIPPDVVPKDDVIGAVPRIMLVLEAWTEGTLRPVRVQVVSSVADLAVLH